MFKGLILLFLFLPIFFSLAFVPFGGLVVSPLAFPCINGIPFLLISYKVVGNFSLYLPLFTMYQPGISFPPIPPVAGSKVLGWVLPGGVCFILFCGFWGCFVFPLPMQATFLFSRSTAGF